MAKINNDSMQECAFAGCYCKVSEDEHYIKTASGIFCCEACAEGKGCHHGDCNCGANTQQ